MHNLIDIPFKWLIMAFSAIFVIFLILLGFKISDISTVNHQVNQMIQEEGGINGKSLIDIEDYLKTQSTSNTTYALETKDGTSNFPDVTDSKYNYNGKPVTALVDKDIPADYGVKPHGYTVSYTLRVINTGGFFNLLKKFGSTVSQLVIPMSDQAVVRSEYHSIKEVDPYYNVYNDVSQTKWSSSIVNVDGDNLSWAVDGSGNAVVWAKNASSPINLKDGTLALANNTAIKTIKFESPVIGTNFSKLFYGDSNLTSVNLSHVDSSDVSDFSSMFEGCRSLATVDLSQMDTSTAKNMSRMFYGASSLTSLDCSSFDTSNVSDMSQMFANTSSVTNLNVSSFDVSNVSTMTGMFENMKQLAYLDISDFKTTKLTDMSNMFSGDARLVNMDLSSFDTSNVTTMNNLFSEDGSIVSITLSSLNLSSVSDISGMFKDDKKLANVDLTNTVFPKTQISKDKQVDFTLNVNQSESEDLALITG